MSAMETATLKNPDKEQPSSDLCAYNPACAQARIAMIYPQRGGSNWPWITRTDPMSQWLIESHSVDNVFAPFPKATWIYRKLQFSQIAQQVKPCDVILLFSTDIAVALASRLAKQNKHNASLIYVGFTQDGSWPARKIRKIAIALRRCDIVTMFSEQERNIYISRFGLAPEQAVVIPIPTDEVNNYTEYSDHSFEPHPYVLALGSPNRRFTPTAQICKKLGLPLVIITRPWHEADSLSELASLGAKIITNADKFKALSYLKHAKLAVMPFVDDSIAGGFTTIMHAMFMCTPMVATQCLGVSEHIIDGETGFVTPHNDSESLLNAIDHLWSQPCLAQKFGEAAIKRAQQRHSLSAAAMQYSKLIEKTLS